MSMFVCFLVITKKKKVLLIIHIELDPTVQLLNGGPCWYLYYEHINYLHLTKIGCSIQFNFQMKDG